MRRPRARSPGVGELALASFDRAISGAPLDAATLAAIAARRFASAGEPVAAVQRPRAASKSAVLCRFVRPS